MNQLLVFVCDGAPVRGEFVSIGSAWQNIVALRNDPPAVQKVMGEFVAAATLLTASIKLDGTLMIQAQSKGPIQLLVVECTSNLKFGQAFLSILILVTFLIMPLSLSYSMRRALDV